MRRSKSIRLVLLGATAVTLGACGDEDLSQGEYYADEAACQRAGGAECARAFAEARQNHMTTAPQFASLADCERDYGANNCEMGTQAAAVSPPPPPSTTGSGSTGTSTYRSVHYFPIMHGFTYYPRAPIGSMGAPVYQDRFGNAFSGRTRVGSFSPGGSFTGTSSRRGGFGGSFRSSGS